MTSTALKLEDQEDEATQSEIDNTIICGAGEWYKKNLFHQTVDNSYDMYNSPIHTTIVTQAKYCPTLWIMNLIL